MSSFSEKGLLGELEQLVLLAVVRLGDDAYAVTVRDEIQRQARIDLRRSSVYVTLDRLERKGYLRSRFGEPTPERGGKAKRHFALTAEGHRALSTAARAIERLRRPARSRA